MEAGKLFFLMRSEVKISFRNIIKAVLSGLAFSMNTPNRIGEYFGRILSLKKGQRLIAANYSIVSGLAQLFVTILAGSVSILLLKEVIIKSVKSDQLLKSMTQDYVIVLLISTGLLLLFIYFFYTAIFYRICRLFPIKKLNTLASAVKKISKGLLFRILMISVVRFIIFTTQYLLILHSFGVKFDYYTGFALISIIFLIMAIIPTIAFAELGIRGKVTLIVAGGFTSQLLALTAATVFVWVLNLVVPAIIGTIFLWKVNLRD